jgi:hypothetical protein
VILDGRTSPDMGVLLGWRVDLAAAPATTEDELPFLAGPVAVGEPVDDPSGALGLSVDHAGLVGVRTRTHARRAPEVVDAAARVAGWDSPMQ